MEITAEKVQQLRVVSRDPVLLDLPVGEMANLCWETCLRGNSAESTHGPVIDREVRDENAGVLRTCWAEEKVIRMRFGIGYDREHTLEEIARISG